MTFNIKKDLAVFHDQAPPFVVRDAWGRDSQKWEFDTFEEASAFVLGFDEAQKIMLSA